MNRKDLIYYGIVLALLIAVVYMVDVMQSETAQCLRNPYIYGASKMGNVSCDCVQFNSVCPAKFSFTDSFFNDTPTICGKPTEYGKIDIGALNLSTP